MKKYKYPIIEISIIDEVDILTTSLSGDDDGVSAPGSGWFTELTFK